ncbi:MAG: ABC transporter permease subunit [Candidatus Hodarchaeota archaeon]
MTIIQFTYLFKRELQAARRNRGIMLTIIVMPVLLWSFQIVLPLMRLGIVNSIESTSYELETRNEDINPSDISMDLGLPAMMAIILTFLSIIPYIASSIAGERENRTMESLLSLPISRLKILLAKFAAGTVLGTLSLSINLICLILYFHVTNEIIAPANNWYSIAFTIDLNLTLLSSISLTLFLCTLLNLGIGISIASLAKSAEVSRQLFSLLILPMMLFIASTMFTGLPEILSVKMGSPLPLILYLIPWMHAIAIFQKTLIPSYFSTNNFCLNPLGNVGIDVFFHLLFICISLALVMWVSAKNFEREGLVS